MDVGPNTFVLQQQTIDSPAFVIKQDPEKTFVMVEATATASALADISAIISQQFTSQSDNSEDGLSSHTVYLINHYSSFNCGLMSLQYL